MGYYVGGLEGRGKRGGCKSVELTYGYSKEQGFEKGIVVGEGSEDLGVGGDVDEDGEGVLGDGLLWL